MDSNNDLVGTFISLTGCDLNQALIILEMSHYNVDNAIELYFTQFGHNNNNKNVTKPAENEIYDEYDENGQEIRKPLSVKRQKLIPSSDILSLSSTPHKSSINLYSSNVVNSKNPKTVQSKEKTLSELFRPPFSIMYNGTFSDARQEGKLHDKWLLLNIQSSEEFTSLQLNRDVWSDETLQNVIQCSFLFLQFLLESEEGSKYVRLYKVSEKAVPHIAIIDPITATIITRVSFEQGDRPDIQRQNEKRFSKDYICDKVFDFISLHETPSKYWEKLSQPVQATPPTTSTSSSVEYSPLVLTGTSNGPSTGTGGGTLSSLSSLSSLTGPMSKDCSESAQRRDTSKSTSGFMLREIFEYCDIRRSTRSASTMEDTSKPGPGGEQAQAISIRFRSSEPSFKCSGSSKVVKRYGANDTVGDLLFSIEDLMSDSPPLPGLGDARIDLMYGYPPQALSLFCSRDNTGGIFETRKSICNLDVEFDMSMPLRDISICDGIVVTIRLYK